MSGDFGRIAPGVAEAPVQLLTVFVTTDGKWVLPGSQEFFAALGDPDPDYDAAGFAVRNLGFVKFHVVDRIVAEIELHPRNVDLRSLLALERLLCESGTNLFRIKYLQDEWRSEISASAEHTVARLHELCAPVFEPPATERFRVETRDPSDLFDPIHDGEGLALMARKWRVAFGNFDNSVLGLASRSDLMPLMATPRSLRKNQIRSFALSVTDIVGHRGNINSPASAVRLGMRRIRNTGIGLRRFTSSSPLPDSRVMTASPRRCRSSRKKGVRSGSWFMSACCCPGARPRVRC
jgi:hypothetical protein